MYKKKSIKLYLKKKSPNSHRTKNPKSPMSHTWHTSYFLNRQYVPILVNCRHHTTNGRCKKSFYFLHRPFVHVNCSFALHERTMQKGKRLFARSVFVARTDDAKSEGDFLHGLCLLHKRTMQKETFCTVSVRRTNAHTMQKVKDFLHVRTYVRMASTRTKLKYSGQEI